VGLIFMVEFAIVEFVGLIFMVEFAIVEFVGLIFMVEFAIVEFVGLIFMVEFAIVEFDPVELESANTGATPVALIKIPSSNSPLALIFTKDEFIFSYISNY
ncbi:MAG: hypothetical protein ACREBA_03570, partial [Nitrosotalea sp.]